MMHATHALHVTAIAAVATLTGTLLAQAPQEPPPKPDGPAVTRHVDAARKAAGTEWTQAVDFICKVNPDRANRPDDPLIAPTKVFDNVYAIGRLGTVVWTITTSEGIVLIDAGYADQLETVLLPGLVKRRTRSGEREVRAARPRPRRPLRRRRLLPAARRACRVVGRRLGSDGDAARAGARRRPGARGPGRPKRDVVAMEGQAITIGDVKFTPVLSPGTRRARWVTSFL